MLDRSFRAGPAQLAPLGLTYDAWLFFPQLPELIDTAKANPGKFNCGSGGNGTHTHLGGELFKREAGIDLVHVPYKGVGQVQLVAAELQRWGAVGKAAGIKAD